MTSMKDIRNSMCGWTQSGKFDQTMD